MRRFNSIFNLKIQGGRFNEKTRSYNNQSKLFGQSRTECKHIEVAVDFDKLPNFFPESINNYTNITSNVG